MAGIMAGHPLDTIKVRLQLDPRKITGRHCAYETLTNEGVLGLYKGMLIPLMGAVPLNASVFMVSDYSRKYMDRWHPSITNTN